jgi:hypothetical protein
MSGAALREPLDFGRLRQWIPQNAAAGAEVAADAAVARVAVVTIAPANTAISLSSLPPFHEL